MTLNKSGSVAVDGPVSLNPLADNSEGEEQGNRYSAVSPVFRG